MDNGQVEKVTARWVCRLYCDCPYCGASMELSGDEEIEQAFLEPSEVFPGKYTGEEIACNECMESFLLHESEENITYWKCSLGCECPKCGEYIELGESRDISEIDERVKDGEYALFFDTEMSCAQCNHTFIVEEPEAFLTPDEDDELEDI